MFRYFAFILLFSLLPLPAQEAGADQELLVNPLYANSALTGLYNAMGMQRTPFGGDNTVWKAMRFVWDDILRMEEALGVADDKVLPSSLKEAMNKIHDRLENLFRMIFSKEEFEKRIAPFRFRNIEEKLEQHKQAKLEDAEKLPDVWKQAAKIFMAEIETQGTNCLQGGLGQWFSSKKVGTYPAFFAACLPYFCDILEKEKQDSLPFAGVEAYLSWLASQAEAGQYLTWLIEKENGKSGHWYIVFSLALEMKEKQGYDVRSSLEAKLQGRLLFVEAVHRNASSAHFKKNLVSLKEAILQKSQNVSSDIERYEGILNELAEVLKKDEAPREYVIANIYEVVDRWISLSPTGLDAVLARLNSIIK